MPSYSRELTVLGLLAATLWLPECSQLTKVDWSLIPPAGGMNSGGMSSGGMPDLAGAAGERASAGEAGTGEGQMGGASGEAGLGGEGGTGDTGGSETPGGRGGSNTAGNGGAGGAVGGTGGAVGGTGGAVGGTGGAGPLHPTCTTAPTTPLAAPATIASALVFFDGGAAASGSLGGRAGLRQMCVTAKDKLGLLQTATEAVITLDASDQIYDMPEKFGIPKTSPHVVSPYGIEFADSWAGAWRSAGTPSSLVCTGVMPPTVATWLTGSSNEKLGISDGTVETLGYGVYEYSSDLAGNQFSHACNGWTFGTDDPDVLARVGSTIAVKDGGGDGFSYFIRYRLYSCQNATSHVLCVAYNKAP